MKNLSRLLAYFILIATVVSCTTPQTPLNVQTRVAATMESLTQIPPPPNGTSSLLPHSLYFLNNDGAGLAQVFRLEKDGVGVTQLTFEPSQVKGYDVSPVDGSVVYISNNQLLTVNPDGSNRSMIFDGGPRDENNSFLTDINSPVWSPDGGTIAFGYKGLNFYSIAGGQANLVIENQVDELSAGQFLPREMYWPETYAADGSKLVITLGYYEGASTAIYYLNGGALVRLKNDEGALICCGDYSLTQDGSALFAANPTSGMFVAGLWSVDTSTGSTSTLLDGSFNTKPDAEVADDPFPGPEGQLYFFYAHIPSSTDLGNRPPLQMVRSALDGVTNRTVLRNEIFTNMNEALWSPDASFVIAAMAEIPDIYQGGAAQLFYIDGQKAMVPLLPYAMSMKWGP